eukprot:TRINITY_DN6981_c0_g1_i1.p1 TRINITY_DN6981_c0_g1~~TRINITY_DN6981_c0_g1_i1.p1  ORF type:complete len:153 (+),score=23.80 TRINITY_DN6981_c0_g1_i1:372-830(+)
MTLRKASTLAHLATVFTAVAMLSAIRPAAAALARSVATPTAQPIDAAGTDTLANDGVVMASMLRAQQEMPVFTVLDYVKAGSACTKLDVLCKKPAPAMDVGGTQKDCSRCRASCIYVASIANVMERPGSEQDRWYYLAFACGARMKKLGNNP